MPTCTQYFVKHWGIDKKNETKFFFKELYNLAERPHKTIRKHFNVLDFMIKVFFLNLRMNNECSLKYSERPSMQEVQGKKRKNGGGKKGCFCQHCSHDQRREQGFP